MLKKRVLILALACCLVAIVALGSLAYFSDTSETVQNKFQVADSTITDPDELFSIKLDEADIANPGSRTTTGNTYTNIAPGSVIAKDPTVENTGEYDQWVRVKVTMDHASEWTAALGSTNIYSIFNVSSDWTRSDAETISDSENNRVTYVYYLNTKLAKDETNTLFTQVTIPMSFSANEMVALREFNVNIIAEAIQSDNNGATAQEGFTNWS